MRTCKLCGKPLTRSRTGYCCTPHRYKGDARYRRKCQRARMAYYASHRKQESDHNKERYYCKKEGKPVPRRVRKSKVNVYSSITPWWK